jgi:hypothetical protein
MVIGITTPFFLSSLQFYFHFGCSLISSDSASVPHRSVVVLTARWQKFPWSKFLDESFCERARVSGGEIPTRTPAWRFAEAERLPWHICQISARRSSPNFGAPISLAGWQPNVVDQCSFPVFRPAPWALAESPYIQAAVEMVAPSVAEPFSHALYSIRRTRLAAAYSSSRQSPVDPGDGCV